MQTDRIFRMFWTRYISVFIVSSFVSVFIDIFKGVGLSNLLNTLALHAIFSMVTAWALIYWRDERFIRWRKRKFGKQDVNDNSLPLKPPKKKRKAKSDIEKLRSMYGKRR